MVETYSKTYISKEIKIHWQDLSFAHKTKTMNRTLTRYHFSIYFFADDYLLTKPWKQYYLRLDLNRCPAAAKQHKQMIHTERLVRRTFGKSVTVHRSPSNKLKRELKILKKKKLKIEIIHFAPVTGRGLSCRLKRRSRATIARASPFNCRHSVLPAYNMISEVETLLNCSRNRTKWFMSWCGN